MGKIVRRVLPVTALAVLCGSQLAYAGDPFGLKGAVKETTEAVKQDAKDEAAGTVKGPADEMNAAKGVMNPKAAAKEQGQEAVKGGQDAVQQGAHDTMHNAVEGVTNPEK
jgi:hypothetical protein